MNLEIVYEKGDTYWVATAVDIPGAFSQGETIDEARENLLDAIRELFLAQRQLVEAEIEGKEVIRETVTLALQ